MQDHQEISADDCTDTEEVRHCSVCFAVIPLGARVRRSLEGHCYCERCSQGFFKKIKLRGLRRDSTRLPGETRIPA